MFGPAEPKKIEKPPKAKAAPKKPAKKKKKTAEGEESESSSSSDEEETKRKEAAKLAAKRKASEESEIRRQNILWAFLCAVCSLSLVPAATKTSSRSLPKASPRLSESVALPNLSDTSQQRYRSAEIAHNRCHQAFH